MQEVGDNNGLSRSRSIHVVGTVFSICVNSEMCVKNLLYEIKQLYIFCIVKVRTNGKIKIVNRYQALYFAKLVEEYLR